MYRAHFWSQCRFTAIISTSIIVLFLVTILQLHLLLKDIPFLIPVLFPTYALHVFNLYKICFNSLIENHVSNINIRNGHWKKKNNKNQDNPLAVLSFIMPKLKCCDIIIATFLMGIDAKSI